MDDSLPSYGEATTRDHWSIIASFVRSADLCSAALVCRKWNKIFSALLWGNPASHFGTEHDAVYVALVRFKRTLVWARSSTREQTHTLHLPPAQAEIYDGPRSEWLSDIMHRLPRLQSLLVSHLPFFDHGALSSLLRLSQPDVARGLPATTYNLRLLDASYCNNLTPQALASALKLLPALTYLDLSGITSARYHEVLSSLTYVPALQILKLQRLSLHDADLEMLINLLGRTLRNLDIRWNRITDHGVRALIQGCIRSDVSINGSASPRRLNTKVQQILDSHLQDQFVREQLTSGFASHIGIESSLGHGITHLFISNNLITAGGAAGLLRCSQLQVLDIGDIATETITKLAPKYELPNIKLALPQADKLISIIEEQAKNLTYLRINHAVVTQPVSVKNVKALELDGTAPITPCTHAAELDASERPVYEMSSDHRHEMHADVPVYVELEGSPVPVTRVNEQVSAFPIHIKHDDIGRHANSEPTSAVSPTLDASGGLFSPISLTSPDMPNPLQLHKSFTSGLLTVPGPMKPLGASGSGLEVDRRVEDASLPQVLLSHRRTYSGVLDEHAAGLLYKQSQTHALLPGTLGQLRTLVLTDVPFKSDMPEIATQIINFVRSCSEEEHWAEVQASVGYQMPPGPDRRTAERQYARTLFPLRKLVLEMAHGEPVADLLGTWNRTCTQSHMLSSTLDPDCETYLNAAKGDFSFFGSEECGQPDIQGLAPIPAALYKEKMMVTADEGAGIVKNLNGDTNVWQQRYDVLAEISKFRQMKKAEYSAAGGHSHVDGYWSGTIEVVRPGRQS